MEYKGMYKLIEEMGELNQALGKLCAYPGGHHPDEITKGRKPIINRVEDEIADVLAALNFFVETNGLDIISIELMRTEKEDKFSKKYVSMSGPRYEGGDDVA